MFKFYRGTTQREAIELLNDVQTRNETHWTDSLEKASMYSKGAVIEIELDELPEFFDTHRSVCEGDSVHGTFRQWVLPCTYFEETVCNFVEEARIHPI